MRFLALKSNEKLNVLRQIMRLLLNRADERSGMQHQHGKGEPDLDSNDQYARKQEGLRLSF